MPNYFYTAKSFDGQTKTDTVFAEDLNRLALNLKSQNLFLVKATLEGEKKKRDINIAIPFMGVKAVEKIMMVRNLWIMFGAGLSLGKIFDILSTQARNPRLKKIMIDIDTRINKGESFSESLARYPKVFNDFFQSMVRIGEESGTLRRRARESLKK